MRYRYLFGPVPSRRLGISLGIDLVPFKTCTLNCIYCECGKTTDLTIERFEYVPIKTVIEELRDYLSTGPTLDYITFSGSGEPTLNSGIGRVVNFLTENYRHYVLCLLTNGTLLSDPAVRSAIRPIDLVIPSLDAANEETFQRINRPHEKLNCADTIEGIKKLRSEHDGKMILEIFIVPGVNDGPAEIEALKRAVESIKPDLVQLGTLDRPGAEEWVEAADPQKMQEVAAALGKAELISEFGATQKVDSFSEPCRRQILDVLRRRPCTIGDLEQILNLHPTEIQKYINQMLKMGKIEIEHKNRGAFIKIKNKPGGYF